MKIPGALAAIRAWGSMSLITGFAYMYIQVAVQSKKIIIIVIDSLHHNAAKFNLLELSTHS